MFAVDLVGATVGAWMIELALPMQYCFQLIFETPLLFLDFSQKYLTSAGLSAAICVDTVNYLLLFSPQLIEHIFYRILICSGCAVAGRHTQSSGPF